jgi:hypothetical protein
VHGVKEGKAAPISLAKIMLKIPDKVGPDEPLRLKVAAAIAFPDYSMTASGLRREAARGRLVIERVAGKDYTTLANIAEMRRRCQQRPKAQDCGFVPLAGPRKESFALPPSGSSSMEASMSPRDALRAKLSAHSKGSPNTLPANTSRRAKSAR